MAKLRVDSLSSAVRFYSSEIDPAKPLHEEDTPWEKVVILQFLDNGEVRVSCAKEALTFAERKELRAYLKSLGYLSCTFRHRKEFSIPL